MELINAYFNDLNTYEQYLMKSICSNETIRKLLAVSSNKIPTSKSLVYTQVFPFAYIPDTQQQAKTFICFYIVVPTVTNSLIKDLLINIDIITHQSLMRTPNGKITTILANEIDNMFNGNRELALGKAELTFVDIDIPIKDYHTRRLQYRITDWNRVNKYY